MSSLESDFILYLLSALILVLIGILSYQVVRVVRSNVYFEKRIKRAEAIFAKKEEAQSRKESATRKGSVKMMTPDTSCTEDLFKRSRKSAG